MPLINLDNSKRSTYVSCPKKYYWNYKRHLQPKYGQESLRFGKVYHKMQESWRKSKINKISKDLALAEVVKQGLDLWEKETKEGFFNEEENYRTFPLCYDAFKLYLDIYGDEDVIPLETEHYFSVPLIQEDTWDVNFAGKIDCIGKLTHGDNLAIFDDKTTTFSPSIAKEQYRRSAQLLGYSYIASKLKDFHTNIAYVNFVFIKKLKSGITVDHDRAVYTFSDYDYVEWHKSLVATAYRILESHKTNNFPMEFDSCYGKYGVCKYLDLCTTPHISDEYIQSKFYEKEWLIYE